MPLPRAPQPYDGITPGDHAYRPPLPEGARWLPPEEAVMIILSGNHPEASQGDALMDLTVVTLLQEGLAQAALLPDGRIAFAPTSLE